MNSTHNFLFVSDFHISEGRNPQTGLTHRNEDFFHDVAFAQFVTHYVTEGDIQGKPWKLVLNGDLFDFLQVISLPDKDELADIIGKRPLTENEQKYGLGTSERVSVWKLKKIAEGHPLLFQALAWFVAHPQHEIILLKGNHDIELVWPAVQKAFRTCLADAYATWRQKPAMLPMLADLPDVLTTDLLDTAVKFKPFFYYVPDLFYVEHGCQYDPANAFQDFEKPTMKVRNEQVIDLPQGSFFVRYFFNKVEHTHPFADNIKPMSRYVFWLLSGAPAQGIGFLTTIIPDYVRTVLELRQKRVKKVIKYVQMDDDGRTHPTEFWEKFQKIQADVREELHQAGKQTVRKAVAAVVMGIIAFLFLLLFIYAVGAGSWGILFLSTIGLIMALIGTAILFRSIEDVFANMYLYRGAERVADLLNSKSGTQFGPVRYMVFGHDHIARSWELKQLTTRHRPHYRQWYVNTGSWIPVFSELDRLERPSTQLTYFCLIPSQITDEPNSDVPQLYRWSEEANAPVPVRMFAQPENS